jgi:HlyD family secretion protein
MNSAFVPVRPVLLLVLTALALSLSACNNGSGKGRTIDLSGTVEAREADLSFQVGGRINALPVEEGAVVKGGEVVATLDDADYQLALKRARAEYSATGAAVEQARARLKFTRSDLARIRHLAQKNMVSPEKLEQAQLAKESAAADLDRALAQVEVARAAVDTAKRQLQYVQLIAPNAGTISTRLAEVGEVVPPGKTVLRLAETSRPWVRAYINEADLSRVRLGQEAQVRVDGLPNTVFKGRLSFISPKAEFTPKTVETHALRVDLVYRVRVEVNNPDGALKIGMPADVTLQAVADKS